MSFLLIIKSADNDNFAYFIMAYHFKICSMITILYVFPEVHGSKFGLR